MPLSAVTALQLSAVALVAVVATGTVGRPRVGSGPPLQMSVARAGHTATRLPDGTVLIAGGYGENGQSDAGAWVVRPRATR